MSIIEIQVPKKSKLKRIQILNLCDLELLQLILMKTITNEGARKIIFDTKNLYNKNASFSLTIDDKEKIEYEVIRTNLDISINLKKYFEELCKILKESNSNVFKLPTQVGYEIPKELKPQYLEINENQKQSIYTIITYKIKDNIDKKQRYNIIDLAIDIFIRLASTQFLPNGNKRNAVLFLCSFLRLHNFYLTSFVNLSRMKYLNDWEQIVTIAATGYKYEYKEISNDIKLVQTKNKKLTDKELHEFIYKYIIKKLYIYFGK